MIESILAKLQRRAARLGNRLSELERTTDLPETTKSRLGPPATDFDLGVRSLDAALYGLALERFSAHLAVNIGDAKAWVNSGLCLEMLGDFAKAKDAYLQATTLDRNIEQAWYNLAILSSHEARTDLTIEYLHQTIRVNPENHAARVLLALKELRIGEYAKGFSALRARAHPLIRQLPPPTLIAPWNGEPLLGKSVLVWCDWGGLSDAIQFCRYVDWLKKSMTPARVALVCPSVLQRLFASSFDFDVISAVPATSQYDFQIPLLDLPFLHQTSVNTVPAQNSYLRAEAGQVAQWKERIARYPGKNIGVVWQTSGWEGDPWQRRNQEVSSLSPNALAKLVELPAVQFFSLQKTIATIARPLADHKSLPSSLVDFTSELADFADTAAMIENLDGIVTVDTSVAHLAGALGKPTFLLAGGYNGHYWLDSGETTPWYPSIRISRRSPAEPWDDALRAAQDWITSTI